MPLKVYLTPEKYVLMQCELYESFEELKYKIFKTLNFPQELLIHMAFYEVCEQNEFFDETFIENFVRVSDVLGTWELAHMTKITTHQDDDDDETAVVSQKPNEERGKIYLKFRYHLMDSNKSKILQSIEDIFLFSEFYRLLHVNRIAVTPEQFSAAMAVYVKLRNPDTTIKNMSNLIKEARHAIAFYGKFSGYNIKISYELVLNGLANFAGDNFGGMKKFILSIFEGTGAYKAQYFKINFEPESIIQNDFPSNVLLLVNPLELLFTTTKLTIILALPFTQIRTLNIVKQVIVLTTTIKIDETENGQPIFKKYSFRNNQAKTLYKTIVNYINFALNGSFKEPEISFQRPYRDSDKIEISKSEMAVIIDNRRTNHPINRFYKKC